MPHLVLEGRVAAVSADRGHRFSKSPQDRVLLVKGHGVEGEIVFGRRDDDVRLRLPIQRQIEIAGKDLPARAVVGFEEVAFAPGRAFRAAGSPDAT